MAKDVIAHLDDQTCDDISISSMMLISELANGEIRFDCRICMRRYKHHPSLFRHFKNSHTRLYEQKVALREKLKSEREALKILGLPYLRRKNQKRKMSRKDGGSGSSPPSSRPRLELSPEMDHVSIKENEDVLLSCSLCHHIFSSHIELNLHASQCKVETNASTVPSNLDPFVEYLVKSNEIFVCLICGTDLGNMSNYIVHMNEEHGKSPLCSPDYENMITFDLIEDERKPTLTERGYYFCDACGEFVDMDPYSSHRCDIDSILKVYNIM